MATKTTDSTNPADEFAQQIGERIKAIKDEIGPMMEELAKLEKAHLALLSTAPKRRGRPPKAA